MAVRHSFRFAHLARAVLILIAGVPVHCAIAAEPEVAKPEHYVLNYPLAERFCPPVDTYFDDVSQAIQKVGGKTIRHQLNGGYGLPIVDKIGDQNVLHLGADVAWTSPGTPIHAIANGVVRLSQGVAIAPEQKTNGPKKTDAKTKELAAALPNAMAALAWGNLIVIEHHLPGGRYVTSIYGHLSNRRLVAAGDIVQAGQVIGFEGRKGIENGGYTPHLHLGIREGRMFETDSDLFSGKVNGTAVTVKLVSQNENELEVRVETELPELKSLTASLSGREYTITARDGKLWAPNAMLNAVSAPPGYAVGYGPSTKGWLDPTDFLRMVAADVSPAPYGPVPKLVAAKSSKPPAAGPAGVEKPEATDEH